MIFLHSSFRTSSTYIWSRFRRNSKCIAYYEIFNEVLSSLSAATINDRTHDTWDSKHPPGAPYFLEYFPLLQSPGGVLNFDPSLSYERFIPQSGPSGPVTELETTYVRTLIDHAEQSGRMPVLTATRSLGRVAGLKASAPGLHVILYRNLHQQWCSYTEQYIGGQVFFLQTIKQIMELNKHDPMIKNLLTIFPVNESAEKSKNTFYLFIFLHIYLYAHAASAADLILDVNRIADDSTYRTEMELVFDAEGLDVDFSDARQSTAYSLVNFSCRTDLLEQIQVISEAIIGTVPSERGRAFITKIVADLIEEYDRHEFYSRRLRSVALSSWRDRDGAVAAAKDAKQQLAGLQGEKSHCEAERNDAVAAAEDVRRQLADLQGERDRSAVERNQAVAAAEGLRRQCADLQGDRDQCRAARDEAVAAVEESRRQAEGLRTECDRLANERDAAIRDQTLIEDEHRQLGRDLASLSDSREGLTSERDLALAACGEAERERQLIAARYYALLHWSLAYHDSTAASWSWRLTRPLRWLGLGRPKRPEKPDLL